MSLRSRYVVTFLFTLALLGAAGSAHAAERGAEHREPARFSADAVALRQAGWSLADLATSYEDGETASVSLTLVDAARTQAVRLSLGFSEYGEHLADYTRASVPVPAERRVYPQADALFESLAHGAVERMYQECGTSVLDLVGDGDAVIDEYSWHVLERSVNGKDAGAALASELRGGLAAGAHIANVYESEGGVAFVLVGETIQTRELNARVDATGAVVGLEVRRSPGAWSSAKLTSEAKLARALVRGKNVRSVSLAVVGGSTRVRLSFTSGKRVHIIDLADLEYEDEGCGC